MRWLLEWLPLERVPWRDSLVVIPCRFSSIWVPLRGPLLLVPLGVHCKVFPDGQPWITSLIASHLEGAPR